MTVKFKDISHTLKSSDEYPLEQIEKLIKTIQRALKATSKSGKLYRFLKISLVNFSGYDVDDWYFQECSLNSSPYFDSFKYFLEDLDESESEVDFLTNSIENIHDEHFDNDFFSLVELEEYPDIILVMKNESYGPTGYYFSFYGVFESHEQFYEYMLYKEDTLVVIPEVKIDTFQLLKYIHQSK
jgi:hypothetical protein